MKRYVILEKYVPTEETLALCPEAKTEYYLFGEDGYVINYAWSSESYDFNDPKSKLSSIAFGWKAPEGCKTSLREHQNYAEEFTKNGDYIVTCEMVEVEV